jgi:hypothetical protein
MPDAPLPPLDPARFVLVSLFRQRRVKNPERTADEVLAVLQDAGLLIVPKPETDLPSVEW